MEAQAGQLLDHFRLVEKLGEGGMGVVWRAVDTTLDREVAIKILPDALKQHPERLERFEREAKVLASLHHPNIAMIHGLHDAEGVRFLSMELIEGEDLAKELARGPLPTIDALKLCAQVARALQAAHDRNIIHRDLKPANIVRNASGEAKVLDFGLAKVLDPDLPAESGETSARTLTTGGTMAGVILGTAAYMSPEQARGKPTDRRTDIWSFGCVLHECLTGVSEFRGDTMSDSIGAILHKVPDWNVLPADLPVTVHWLLRRCLTKDRDSRLHDIADARIELEQAIVDPECAGVGQQAQARSTAETEKRPWLRWVMAAGLMAIAGLVAWWAKPTPVLDAPLVELSLQLSRPQSDRVLFTISPDGSSVVYRIDDPATEGGGAVQTRLWLRRLDSFVASPIPGTEDAGFPEFSPDGRNVVFIVDREGGGPHQADVRVVGLDGRPPLTVATNALDHSPPQWLSSNEIVFVDHESEKRLLRVSRGGGDSRIFTELPKESRFSTFDFRIVDDGRWIANDTFSDAVRVVLMISTENGGEFEFLRDAHQARFLEDGRVVFLRSTAMLVAQVDFDASPPAVVGDVRTVMGSGSNSEDQINSLAVSEAGHLAFITGEGRDENRRLMTIDRQGNVEPLIEAKGAYAMPVRFSDDGRRLLVAMPDDESPTKMWVVELDTGARRPIARNEPITFGGSWIADDRIVFTSWRSIEEGKILTREMRRDAVAVPLFDDWPEGLRLRGGSLANDGTNLLFEAQDGGSASVDIWVRTLDGASPAQPLVATDAAEGYPSLSPDNRWLAYQSNESGRNEVYVRPYESSGKVGEPVVKVSRTGGAKPVWSSDGRDLFFLDDRNNALMAATIEGTERPRVSEPRKLIPDLEAIQLAWLFGEPPLLPMPGDERLAFVQNPGGDTKIDRIEVVLNWAKQLER